MEMIRLVSLVTQTRPDQTWYSLVQPSIDWERKIAFLTFGKWIWRPVFTGMDWSRNSRWLLPSHCFALWNLDIKVFCEGLGGRSCLVVSVMTGGYGEEEWSQYKISTQLFSTSNAPRLHLLCPSVSSWMKYIIVALSNNTSLLSLFSAWQYCTI